MKTYSMSKQDIDYLFPVYTNMSALNTAIQVHIINVVFPRLGIPKDAVARYDILKGEIMVEEKEDNKKIVTPTTKQTVEVNKNKITK